MVTDTAKRAMDITEALLQEAAELVGDSGSDTSGPVGCAEDAKDSATAAPHARLQHGPSKRAGRGGPAVAEHKHDAPGGRSGGPAGGGAVPSATRIADLLLKDCAEAMQVSPRTSSPASGATTAPAGAKRASSEGQSPGVGMARCQTAPRLLPAHLIVDKGEIASAVTLATQGAVPLRGAARRHVRQVQSTMSLLGFAAAPTPSPQRRSGSSSGSAPWAKHWRDDAALAAVAAAQANAAPGPEPRDKRQPHADTRLSPSVGPSRSRAPAREASLSTWSALPATPRSTAQLSEAEELVGSAGDDCSGSLTYSMSDDVSDDGDGSVVVAPPRSIATSVAASADEQRRCFTSTGTGGAADDDARSTAVVHVSSPASHATGASRRMGLLRTPSPTELLQQTASASPMGASTDVDVDVDAAESWLRRLSSPSAAACKASASSPASSDGKRADSR